MTFFYKYLLEFEIFLSQVLIEAQGLYLIITPTYKFLIMKLIVGIRMSRILVKTSNTEVYTRK